MTYYIPKISRKFPVKIKERLGFKKCLGIISVQNIFWVPSPSYIKMTFWITFKLEK